MGNQLQWIDQCLIKEGKRMNAGIIAKQMLVLFLIMMAGYAAFKKGIVSKEGAGSISSAIINIFNPCLIIS